MSSAHDAQRAVEDILRAMDGFDAMAAADCLGAPRTQNPTWHVDGIDQLAREVTRGRFAPDVNDWILARVRERREDQTMRRDVKGLRGGPQPGCLEWKP